MTTPAAHTPIPEGFRLECASHQQASQEALAQHANPHRSMSPMCVDMPYEPPSGRNVLASYGSLLLFPSDRVIAVPPLAPLAEPRCKAGLLELTVFKDRPSGVGGQSALQGLCAKGPCLLLVLSAHRQSTAPKWTESSTDHTTPSPCSLGWKQGGC